MICPAMNTGMWEHPVTGRRLEEFKGFWKGKEGECVVVQPKVKVLACGEEGRGAMAEVEVRRRGGL